jgi:hypothetical protein
MMMHNKNCRQEELQIILTLKKQGGGGQVAPLLKGSAERGLFLSSKAYKISLLRSSLFIKY